MKRSEINKVLKELETMCKKSDYGMNNFDKSTEIRQRISSIAVAEMC